jgi:hypothetical protein
MRARKKEIEDVNAKHSINDVVSAALDQKFKNLASSHIVMKELLETIQGQHRGPRAGELENDVDALKRSIEFNVYTWAATIKLMELYRWIGTPVVLDKYPPELLIYQIQLNEYHASNKSKPAPSVSELYVRDWKTIASNAVTMYSKTKYAPIRGLMESVHEVISDVLISTQGHSGRQKLYAHIFWMPFTLTSHILGLQPAPGLPAPSTLVCNMQILAQRTDTTPPDCATA